MPPEGDRGGGLDGITGYTGAPLYELAPCKSSPVRLGPAPRMAYLRGQAVSTPTHPLVKRWPIPRCRPRPHLESRRDGKGPDARHEVRDDGSTREAVHQSLVLRLKLRARGGQMEGGGRIRGSAVHGRREREEDHQKGCTLASRSRRAQRRVQVHAKNGIRGAAKNAPAGGRGREKGPFSRGGGGGSGERRKRRGGGGGGGLVV